LILHGDHVADLFLASIENRDTRPRSIFDLARSLWGSDLLCFDLTLLHALSAGADRTPQKEKRAGRLITKNSN